MATTFTLSVVAPDRLVAEETVTSVVSPGVDGYFGVMAGHEALVAALRPGLVEYVDPTNNRHYIYVGGGFADVSAGKVTILADEAHRAQDIDASEAEKHLEEARKALKGEESTFSSRDALEEIERATARIRASRLVK